MTKKTTRVASQVHAQGFRQICAGAATNKNQQIRHDQHHELKLCIAISFEASRLPPVIVDQTWGAFVAVLIYRTMCYSWWCWEAGRAGLQDEGLCAICSAPADR